MNMLQFYWKWKERNSMKSIRNQMLIYLTIGALSIFSIVVFVLQWKLKELPIYMQHYYSEIVSARADEVDKEIKGLVEQVQMISQSPVVRSMDMEKIRAYLPQMRLEKYRNMTVADLQGNAWSTVDDQFNISQQEQYQEIILHHKKYHISQPFYSPFTEQKYPVLIVSHEILGLDNQPSGLVNVVLELPFLNDIVSSLQLTNSGYGWIINGSGMIVAHLNPQMPVNHTIQEMIPDAASVSRIFEQTSGIVEYQGNNEPMITFFKKIDTYTDWTFMITVPQKDLYTEVRDIQNFMIPIMFFTVIACIAFAYIYADSISKPIVQLTNVFQHASEGNFNIRVKEQYTNELAHAARGYNQMMDQIKHLTYRDITTELYNYNGFLLEVPYKIEKIQNQNLQYAVAIISIDDFKRINSMNGYRTGDEVLKQFSMRILSLIQDQGLVARFMGDEFIVLIHQEHVEQLQELIEQLWNVCNGRLLVDGNEFVLRTSIGASIHLNDNSTSDDIIHEATVAKMIAKKNGGNRVLFYNDELSAMLLEEQLMEIALLQALDQDELYLVYQPIADVKTNKIVSAEALLRWNHPKYKSVSPLRFIQIAERNGLILEIGKRTLLQACQQNVKWHDAGYKNLVVSVNVSAVQFDQPNFVQMVADVVKQVGMNPRYLELEITESTSMNYVDDKLCKMKLLRDMGIRLSIDDFGTGYSSLSYFTQFPINTLKIDQSFVKDMEHNEQSKTIVTTIINMAQAIQVETVAEGVESVEQLQILRELGCNKIQGYCFSRPIMPQDLEVLLQKEV